MSPTRLRCLGLSFSLPSRASFLTLRASFMPCRWILGLGDSIEDEVEGEGMLAGLLASFVCEGSACGTVEVGDLSTRGTWGTLSVER